MPADATRNAPSIAPSIAPDAYATNGRTYGLTDAWFLMLQKLSFT